MKLISSSFEHGDRIDRQHTVEGEDVSPPLRWMEAPAGTQSFALVCDDPDAPSPKKPAAEPWAHWVIYSISGDVSKLPSGVKREREPDEIPGARQGVNSWPSDNVGYRGPAPPPGGGEHRYFFKLYAVDAKLELAAGATKQQLLQAIDGHVLAEAQLMGTYER